MTSPECIQLFGQIDTAFKFKMESKNEPLKKILDVESIIIRFRKWSSRMEVGKIALVTLELDGIGCKMQS